MSRAGGRLAACLVLVLTAACAETGARGPEGRREVEVDAEGWSPIDGGNTVSARQRALAEAQKKAVEKAVGVTLRARTRVDDAISVIQSIEANMGGTIRRYEITSEGEDGAFFKVRIHAAVIYRELEPQTAKKSDPRISVRLSSPKAAGAVRSALASRDYDLVEKESDADIAVTGVVEIRGLDDPRLGGFYSYTAKVSLTAANIRSGKITQVDYEASAVDTEEQVACDRALENAGDQAAADLVSRLTDGGAPAVAAAAAELSDLPGFPDASARP